LIITGVAFAWMHWTILGMLRKATPALEHKFEQPGEVPA
jgi:hypothetical protein